MSDVSELLAAYDSQVRDRVPDPLPEGVTVERDGPLVRFFGMGGRGFVVYRDLGGFEGAELDDLIARQVRVFAERGEEFEWKQHGHDLPEDLSQRLLAAGFVPEETETIVIATVTEIAAEPRLPKGVTLREVTSRADFERIASLERAVWGDDGQETWLVEMLESERTVDPDAPNRPRGPRSGGGAGTTPRRSARLRPPPTACRRRRPARRRRASRGRTGDRSPNRRCRSAPGATSPGCPTSRCRRPPT